MCKREKKKELNFFSLTRFVLVFFFCLFCSLFLFLFSCFSYLVLSSARVAKLGLNKTNNCSGGNPPENKSTKQPQVEITNKPEPVKTSNGGGGDNSSRGKTFSHSDDRHADLAAPSTAYAPLFLSSAVAAFHESD